MPRFATMVAQAPQQQYEIRLNQADGRIAVYKLAVARTKEALFRKACKEGLQVDLRDYGNILDSYFIETGAV